MEWPRNAFAFGVRIDKFIVHSVLGSAYDGDRLNIEDITAQATDQVGNHTRGRTENKEGVVAFHAIDFNVLLGVGKLDLEPGSEDAAIREDKGVIKFGSDYCDPIVARASINIRRQIDIVLDEIIAVAAVDSSAPLLEVPV